MPDILHDFPIAASAARVFEAIASPAGLNEWWTLTSSGIAIKGTAYSLGFGPGYDWRAVVARSEPGESFELAMTRSDADWDGTEVIFDLEQREELTWVRFAHRGWPAANEHFRISSFCWAMYLRVLKRYLEHGEKVPYERRLDV